jgi:hypothetical protein
MDRQGVHAACEFRRQHGIYHAMALDPALPLEGFSHDMYPEMRLSAWTMARMTLMLVRLVHDVQAFGGKSLPQFFRDYVGGTHSLR